LAAARFSPSTALGGVAGGLGAAGGGAGGGAADGVRSMPRMSAVTFAAVPRSRERALAGADPMRVATAAPPLVDIDLPSGASV